MTELAIRCGVCQAMVDEEDLFCPNCGTEVPRAEQAAAPAGRTATHSFQCAGCGASMSYDASAGTLRCPFCGSTRLEAIADAKVLAPELIVPFAVDRPQAVAAMHKWLGSGFWRPGDLSEQALVVTMTPVYLPYWIFEATTYTYWTADTSQTPPGARASWYPTFGEHRGTYGGLLVGASAALTNDETARLAPFDMRTAVPPEKVDLTNVIDERFSVPRKYARPLARQGIESLEIEACSECVPERSRNVHVSTLIEGLASRPVLLPVWIMAYRYRGRLFRFLVNGQTGAATGGAPFSYRKLAVVIGAAVAAVVILMLIFAYAAH